MAQWSCIRKHRHCQYSARTTGRTRLDGFSPGIPRWRERHVMFCTFCVAFHQLRPRLFRPILQMISLSVMKAYIVRTYFYIFTFLVNYILCLRLTDRVDGIVCFAVLMVLYGWELTLFMMVTLYVDRCVAKLKILTCFSSLYAL